MAIYKNRLVDIISHIPFTGKDRVQIQHREPGLGTEIVDKGALELTKEEVDRLNKEDEHHIVERKKAFEDQVKAQDEANKKEVEYHKEVHEAQKKGLPKNAWLKNATYKINEEVLVDGVAYRSNVNNNTGNQPAEGSKHWTVMHQDVTKTIPAAKVL
jgi:hypothetical protein